MLQELPLFHHFKKQKTLCSPARKVLEHFPDGANR